MMRKKLHLPRAIKQHVILPEPPEPFLQPPAIVLQLLERVERPAVGAQLLVRHDLLERDEVADVEGAGVGGAVVGRVEVHDGALAADGGEELLHAVAVGGFAGAGGADYQLGEGHGLGAPFWAGCWMRWQGGWCVMGCCGGDAAKIMCLARGEVAALRHTVGTLPTLPLPDLAGRE